MTSQDAATIILRDWQSARHLRAEERDRRLAILEENLHASNLDLIAQAMRELDHDNKS